MLSAVFVLVVAAIVLCLILFAQNRKSISELRQKQREDLLNLRYLLNVRSAVADERHFNNLSADETIVFDGRTALQATDFSGAAAQDWNYVQHRFDEKNGEGSFEVSGNAITINRTNAGGRFEVHLKRFSFGVTTTKNIPATAEKKTRLLRLSCEVRRRGSPHVLRVVLKGEVSKNVHDEKEVVVYAPEWETVTLFFKISTDEPCGLRFDDTAVLQAPSSIEIRNLILCERSVQSLETR